MFNVSGTELVFLLMIGLVVLGPEKLPGVIKRVGQVYREVKNISDGFKQTVAEAVEEPLREFRGTKDSIVDAVSKIPEPDVVNEVAKDDGDGK